MEEKRLQTRFSTVVSILIYIFPSFGSRWNLYFIKLFPTWPFQAFPYICQVWFNMTFKKELFWLFLVRDPCATSVSLALSILLHIKLIKAPPKKSAPMRLTLSSTKILSYSRSPMKMPAGSPTSLLAWTTTFSIKVVFFQLWPNLGQERKKERKSYSSQTPSLQHPSPLSSSASPEHKVDCRQHQS